MQPNPESARERDVERGRVNQAELADGIARHLPRDGTVEAAPGVFLNRCSVPSGPVLRVAVPSLCVIAQGSKEVLLGAERYRYDEAHYLLVSAEVPLEGYVVEASKDHPYLSVRVHLPPDVVTAVLIEAHLLGPGNDGAARAVAVNQLGADLLDAVVRIVRLVESPEEFRVLGPLVLREIAYRLAVGEEGARLREIALVGGRTHRMANAIELIRDAYDKPLRVEALARRLGMSVSSLQHQFKAVTAMSPVQFQKQLRMLRRLAAACIARQTRQILSPRT